MPPRIVHLLGGLRAVDDRENPVQIEVGHDQRIAEFPRPAYAKLYRQLMARGLRVVGVEFVNYHSYRGLMAPDWQFASPAQGFTLRKERDLWAGARHAAIKDKVVDVHDLAERATTYLDLVSIRIMQLSEAYNKSLRSHLADGQKDSVFFQNTFGRYLDAAIHAFVADAASFRDLIAEALWKLIVQDAGQVTTLATFLKKAKGHPDPFVQSVIGAGGDGGWLRTLSDLRNHITHVAPVGRASAFHVCQPRKLLIRPETQATVLHYPLLEAGGTVHNDPIPVDYEDEDAIRARLEAHKRYCDTSIDALEYASGAFGKLIDLLAALRVKAGVRSEILHLTDDDVIGDITVL